MPKIYRISGVTTTGMKFAVEVTAEKPHDAIEKVFSLLGSRHRLSRTQIKIVDVSAVPPEEAKSEEAKMLLALDRIVKY